MSGTFANQFSIPATRSDEAAVKKQSKIRIQLEVAPRSADRLNVLKEKTEASSYSEVIKNALKLYDGLVEANQQGSEFFIKDRFGTISPFKMFL